MASNYSKRALKAVLDESEAILVGRLLGFFIISPSVCVIIHRVPKKRELYFSSTL